jgi:hypothetical protein
LFVTGAARTLQEAGMIHYSRGRIAVLDRRRLEARACECYAIVKGEYDRLLHPERTAGNASVQGTRRQYCAGCEGPAHTEST